MLFLRYILLSFIIFLLNTYTAQAGLTFFDKNSTLMLDSGSTYSHQSPFFKGITGRFLNTMNKGRILGDPIFFNGGSYADGNFEVVLTATFDPSITPSIRLNGGGGFRVTDPGFIKETIAVSGVNNQVEGLPSFRTPNAIQLTGASTAVTLAIQSQLDTKITLASTIDLGADLVLADNITIDGTGTVNFHDFNLITGKKDLVWTSTLLMINASNFELSSNSMITGRWTLAGSCHFEGNGHILKMGPSGQILLMPGASLLLNNITIEGVSGNKIGNMDCSGTLSFGNVLWKQDADFTFTNGALDVLGLWELVGTSTFIFSPCRVCNVVSQGTIQLDKDMTFFYNPFIDNRDLLAFEDSSAVFAMSGATLATTFTGMRFTKGTLITESHCFMMQNTSVLPALSESIEIGNGDPADEMTVIIGPSSILELLAGRLFYNQVQ